MTIIDLCGAEKKDPWLVAKRLQHLPSRGRDFAAKFASQTAA